MSQLFQGNLSLRKRCFRISKFMDDILQMVKVLMVKIYGLSRHCSATPCWRTWWPNARLIWFPFLNLTALGSLYLSQCQTVVGFTIVFMLIHFSITHRQDISFSKIWIIEKNKTFIQIFSLQCHISLGKYLIPHSYFLSLFFLFFLCFDFIGLALNISLSLDQFGESAHGVLDSR